jgi:phosphoenolpyruvate-protein kinase (PTS system EI component)
MFPFVTTVDEVVRARDHVDRALAALREAGRAAAPPRAIGIMVEIPVTALDPSGFLGHVDFLSVGTNDLAQYLAAAGRTIDEVSELAAHAAGAIDGLVGDLCSAAAAAGRWVGVCGEMAGDPHTAARFVELGVTELSMGPASIPNVKKKLLEVVS